MEKKSRELVMAKLYLKNKDYKMAEKSFNEYLSMNPEDDKALKSLAQVYEQSKRFDKAFEMFERCYLAEPEKPGVLLDICRILLMNEIWLEHVDYRKWLNLAIKAFPSNPIVVNFKAFLATLPKDDKQSPQREFQPKMISNAPGDDPLQKILDKLSTMEKKIENIETRLSNISITQNTTSPATKDQNQTPESKVSQVFNVSPNPSAPNKPELNQGPKIGQSPLNLTTNLFTFSSPPLIQRPTTEVKTPEQPTFFSKSPFSLGTNIFAESMPKFNMQPEAHPPAFTTSTTSMFTAPATSPFTIPTTSVSAAPTTTTFMAPTLAAFASPITAPFAATTATTTTPSTKAFSFSSNLFADSFKKLNMPTEGAWTTQNNSMFNFSKPRETDNDDENEEGGEEVVQNEELAIENTCDMKPIEIKTGEEDEDLLFEHRCKLFRFRDKEYKERGVGSIKVLKHKDTGKGRLIMRRDAVGLVCLNCWDCNKVEQVKDTQVRWMGIDASDGEPEPTVFVVKFKTGALTDAFMSHLTALFPEDASSKNTSLSSPSKPANVKSSNAKPSSNGTPEIELVDPKLDQALVDKARQLQLPDLFYHKLKNQESCSGCNGCEDDS